MKKEITLQFSSAENLVNFWKELPSAPHQVSFTNKLLTQVLSEEEIELAKTKYNAVIVSRGENQKIK